jgi:glutathione S-transferase
VRRLLVSLCDFQMSFAVEAALSRCVDAAKCPKLLAYRDRLNTRPAYQRAIEKGGPVLL